MTMHKLVSTIALAVALCASASAEPEACRPAARFTTAPWWTSRLAATQSAILKEKNAWYDLVLVGDSITHRWENNANGAEVYPKLKAYAEASGLAWLDMSEKFLGENGEIKPGLMMPDNLHPIKEGYEIWLGELAPAVEKLLE